MQIEGLNSKLIEMSSKCLDLTNQLLELQKTQEETFVKLAEKNKEITLLKESLLQSLETPVESEFVIDSKTLEAQNEMVKFYIKI